VIRVATAAIAMIDALLAYFAGGESWLSRGYHDADARRCLLCAMAHIRQRDKLSGDWTGDYIRLAASEVTGRSDCIIGINDTCRDYQELAAILERARILAAATGLAGLARAEARKRRADFAARQRAIDAQRQQTTTGQLLTAIRKAECAFREAADQHAADHGERSTHLDEPLACARREFERVAAALSGGSS
jgi:hypothetical protein